MIKIEIFNLTQIFSRVSALPIYFTEFAPFPQNTLAPLTRDDVGYCFTCNTTLIISLDDDYYCNSNGLMASKTRATAK